VALFGSEETASLKERLAEAESELLATRSHRAALADEAAALRAEAEAARAAAAVSEAAAATAEARAAELHRGLAEAQARVADFQAKDVEVYTRIREAMEAAEQVRDSPISVCIPCCSPVRRMRRQEASGSWKLSSWRSATGLRKAWMISAPATIGP
jgi:predicted  nucleic acid-binding Zn-ribbon protein